MAVDPAGLSILHPATSTEARECRLRAVIRAMRPLSVSLWQHRRLRENSAVRLLSPRNPLSVKQPSLRFRSRRCFRFLCAQAPIVIALWCRLHNQASHQMALKPICDWWGLEYIYIYICGGNPQPEAIGHSQICLQPESGASRTCTVCSLVNWEMTHS